MKKSKIAKLITIILYILLVGGLISSIFLPKLYDIFKDTNIPNFKDQTIYYQVAYYSCYFICLGIIYLLINIFKIIYKDNPFQVIIEVSLKIIAVLFMLLSIIVIIKTIFIPTLLSIVVVLITFLASLSFYVLSQIFKSAINYKNEVDYTI